MNANVQLYVINDGHSNTLETTFAHDINWTDTRRVLRVGACLPSPSRLRYKGGTLEQYKGYWVGGTAKLIHPFNPEFYPKATVYKQGRGSSIYKAGSFELRNFTMDKELAEFFGLELAKIVVDECFP